MQRVLVIGCSGSGKSTFTDALASHAGLPAIHLDQHYFGPGWREPAQELWRERVTHLASGEHWIMDGNYSGTFDLRIPRADTIIFLDVSTARCLWRVFWRTLRSWGKVRKHSPPGCPERLDWQFFHYVANYNVTRRKRILSRLATAAAAGKSVHILHGPGGVDRFWAALRG